MNLRFLLWTTLIVFSMGTINAMSDREVDMRIAEIAEQVASMGGHAQRTSAYPLYIKEFLRSVGTPYAMEKLKEFEPRAQPVPVKPTPIVLTPTQEKAIKDAQEKAAREAKVAQDKADKEKKEADIVAQKAALKAIHDAELKQKEAAFKAAQEETKKIRAAKEEAEKKLLDETIIPYVDKCLEITIRKLKVNDIFIKFGKKTPTDGYVKSFYDKLLQTIGKQIKGHIVIDKDRVDKKPLINVQTILSCEEIKEILLEVNQRTAQTYVEPTVPDIILPQDKPIASITEVTEKPDGSRIIIMHFDRHFSLQNYHQDFCKSMYRQIEEKRLRFSSARGISPQYSNDKWGFIISGFVSRDDAERFMRIANQEANLKNPSVR